MSTKKHQNTTSAFDVAKYFLWRAQNESTKLSNKKIQKLVYYAQAWHLALKDQPLFSDKIEAWIHGPAVASLYNSFKEFGRGPITISVEENDIKDIISQDLLDEVWNAYSKYDADYLEFLTHNEDPWIKARENREFDESSTDEISLDSMKLYYRQRLKEVDSRETA
jgi:uncharacterized phage-associated protein